MKQLNRKLKVWTRTKKVAGDKLDRIGGVDHAPEVTEENLLKWLESLDDFGFNCAIYFAFIVNNGFVTLDNEKEEVN